MDRSLHSPHTLLKVNTYEKTVLLYGALINKMEEEGSVRAIRQDLWPRHYIK